MSNGWIKISRDISNHWLWSDCRRFQWWIDLLLLASWEDRKVMDDGHLFTLKRGQIIASISFLSGRWGVSAPTIIKYLKVLEKEKMIERIVLYRQTSILTICNYERYQSIDSGNVYSQVDSQVDSIVYTNKENKEYKEENIINNNACDNLLKEVEEMKQNQSWLESICMKHHLKPQELGSYFDLFIQECRCNAVNGHDNISEAQKHFHSWLRIYLDVQKKKNNYGNDWKNNRLDNVNTAQQNFLQEVSEFIGEAAK